MEVIISCDLCGTETLKEQKEINRNLKNNHKNYCSKNCVINSRLQKRVAFNCSNCGKKIEKRPCDLKTTTSGKFYCSLSCSSISNNTGRFVSSETKLKMSNALKGRRYSKPAQCNFCNNDFYKTKFNRKYCSKSCYYASKLKKQPQLISLRTWAKIFKRAFCNWKCPYCDWNQTFDIHHIEQRSISKNDKIDNLALLCPNHHSLITRNLWKPSDIYRYAVSNFYTTDEFFKMFYEGNNTELNRK